MSNGRSKGRGPQVEKARPNPTDEMPLVRFRDVTLRVPGRDLFPGTNWSVSRGEQWAVVGLTGSGKSTLLRAICGEVPACAGTIEYGLDGRSLQEGEFSEGDIEMVSVEEHRLLVATALDYHQARWSPVEERRTVTVRHLMGGRQRRRRWPEIASGLNIGTLIGRAIGSLSNGEMRKVLLARALLASPKLLILDDAFAGLDRQSRRQLRSILHRLMGEGARVLLATSRLDEIPGRTTHVLYLEAGRAVLQGRKRAVLANPRIHPLRAVERARNLPRLQWRRPGRLRGRHDEGRPLVEITQARVTYGRVEVLRGITWTVRAGENWTLMGPNGSGKSTLISLITADNPQSYANDLRLFGIRRGSGESIWEIKEHIGWLSPELQYHYYGGVSCYEVVCSGLYDTVGLYREQSQREARAVRRWMRNLQVGAWADTPFAELSDGQQRLVLLARALVKEPPLLIFDEPCQGLDPVHRRRVLGFIDQVARQPHTTVVYVTHHSDEIPAVFGHELRLREGRATRCGRRSCRGARRARRRPESSARPRGASPLG